MAGLWLVKVGGALGASASAAVWVTRRMRGEALTPLPDEDDAFWDGPPCAGNMGRDCMDRTRIIDPSCPQLCHTVAPLKTELCCPQCGSMAPSPDCSRCYQSTHARLHAPCKHAPLECLPLTGTEFISHLSLGLRNVQVFFRHGARTPIYLIPGIEEATYPEDYVMREATHTTFCIAPVLTNGESACQPSDLERQYQQVKLKGGAVGGQLTTYGMDQAYMLGRRLRQDYVYKYPLLDPGYSDWQIDVKSTHMNRTILSARCVLAGLFHNHVLKCKEPIEIDVNCPHLEYLYPNLSTCPEMKEFHASVLASTDDFRCMRKDRLGVEAALGSTFPEGKFDFIAVRDDLVARLTHGLFVPRAIRPWLDIIDKHAVTLLHYAVNGVCDLQRPLATQMAAGRALWHAKRLLREACTPSPLGGDDLSTRRLHLYSCHDALLVGLLEALGIFDWRWPPFAADLRLELWEGCCDQKYVRVLYCGKEMRIRGSQHIMVPLEQFCQIIEPYVMSEEKFKAVCRGPTAVDPSLGEEAPPSEPEPETRPAGM